MWREGWVMGGDTRYFVRAMGHGDDVAVLLHGWPETGAAWGRVAPMLVERGWRVVCPDLKGMGRSEKPSRGYDPETLGDEISQLIRNVHADKALVVGHDWGGAVALATAFRHPGRVSGLVVASSPYRQLDLRRSFHIPLFNVPVLPELAFRFGAGPLVRLAVGAATEAPDAIDPEVLREGIDGVAERPQAWLAYYRTLSRRAARDWAVRRLRRALPGSPLPSRPHRIPVPAHVIWGANDRATPAHLATRVAFDLHAELTLLPDVGHFPHEEAPQAFAAAVLAFADASRPDASVTDLAERRDGSDPA